MGCSLMALGPSTRLRPTSPLGTTDDSFSMIRRKVDPGGMGFPMRALREGVKVKPKLEGDPRNEEMLVTYTVC